MSNHTHTNGDLPEEGVQYNGVPIKRAVTREYLQDSAQTRAAQLRLSPGQAAA